MVERLDSMITLSADHIGVMEEMDMDRVAQEKAVLDSHFAYFTAATEQMLAIETDRSVFTGPLYDLQGCRKYYGRVQERMAGLEKIKADHQQLLDLKAVLEQGQLDSATAVQHFTTEAWVLHDMDKWFLKSFGGCYSCMRQHQDLVHTLDSLKGHLESALE